MYYDVTSADMKNVILQGNALDVLKELPDEYINCVVTSPPYWGLRDYDVEDQLGLEPTFELYIKHLCDIFDEIKRVLKKEGTCWVNLGDSYSNSGKGGDSNKMYAKKHTQFGKICDIRRHGKPTRVKNLLSKCLCLIPQRFAIEMCNRGWILRNTIIWHKPNCMPSSVTDRFTVDFEYLYFFVKNKKYWFEQQYQPYAKSSFNRYIYPVADHNVSLNQRKEGWVTTKNRDKRKILNMNPKGVNKRTVWTIPTQSFSEAHFAVYPEELITTPIRAGCPEGGIVLDPFGGAGTSGVVAKKLNRNYILIELNPEYIKIAENRIKYTHVQEEFKL